MARGGGRIKGITVEIGGDTQGLDKALKGINKSGRDLQRELRDVQRLLKFDPSNAEALAQKQQLVTEQIENTTKKLNALREAEQQVEEKFNLGEISEEQFRAFRREIAFTERELHNLREEIDKTDDSKAPAKAAEDIKKIDRAAQKAKDSLAAMGKGLGAAAKGIGIGAAGAAAGIAGLIAGTTDLNRELARLRFNAFNEGFNVDKIENDFKRVVAITGETDSAVETLANLMQTGFDQEQLSEAIDHINGAAIKFSDTLKTEGIADSLQETFATGKAIGQFGELLERSGIDLEVFNKELAEAAAKGEETNFVLQTMADLGLADSAAGFRDMNKNLIENQEAQVNLQMALAGLGEALMPLTTLVMNFLAKLAEWGTENINLVSSFDSISEGIVALLPQLFGKGLQLVSTIVQAIVQNLPMIMQTGTEILLTIIQGIVQMLPSLIAQFQTLLPLIVQILQQNMPLIISAGVDLILALVNGIIQMLPELIDIALTLIVLISTELLKNLPKIIDAGVKLIIALAKGVIKALPDIDKALTTIIKAIFTALKGIDNKLMEIGKNAISGLIKGIRSKISEVGAAAADIANGLGEKIKGILKLGSPSKLLMSMGQDTGEGFAIGIKNSLQQVKSAAAEMAKTSFPDININKADLQQTAPATNRGNMTVNIHSPKELNAREANVIWQRTMKKMQLQW